MSNVILSTSAAYIAARAVLGDYRKVFDSLEDALKAVHSIFTKVDSKGQTIFPADFPVLAAKVGLVDFTEEGVLPDPTQWADGMYLSEGVSIAVSFVGVRGIETGEVNDKGQPKKANGARALVIYPVFGIDAITGNESGGDWLLKIIEKEMSHVAFRPLRTISLDSSIDELAASAINMPGSVGDYVEEAARESTDSSAFDEIWAQFRKMLKAEPSTTLLAEALPSKQEVIKAIRSVAFAKENYAQLEDMGVFKFIGSTMIAVIDSQNVAKIEAGENTIDSGEIAGWLAKRDTFVFNTAKKVELKAGDVDFGAFMAKHAAGAAGSTQDTTAG